MASRSTQPTSSDHHRASVGRGDRTLFGWRVRTDLPLPEIPEWCGDGRDPDVRIVLGRVPDLGNGAITYSPAIQIAGDALRLEIPGVARYRVDGGSLVTVEPVLPEDSADVRLFLMGTVLSVLCYRRGLIPLHASAVEIDGRALLLAGQSGLGKSTLAAALLARGHRLLADDVCALDFSDPGGPLVWPSFPRLKLWEDAAKGLDIPTQGLEQARVQLRKYLVPVTAYQRTPLRPAHLVLLHRAHSLAEASERRLRGIEAVRRYDAIHRWRLGIALGHQSAIFTGLAALLRVAPMTLLTRPDDLAGLPALADRVLELARLPCP